MNNAPTVVFEGINYIGKSYFTGKVEESLRNKLFSVGVYNFPNDLHIDVSEVGSFIRKLLFNDKAPKDISILFCLERFEWSFKLKQLSKSSLFDFIFLDRYSPSNVLTLTHAYGIEKGVNWYADKLEELWEFEKSIGVFQQNLNVLLSVDTSNGYDDLEYHLRRNMRLSGKTLDVQENASMEMRIFRDRVYRELAERNIYGNWHIQNIPVSINSYERDATEYYREVNQSIVEELTNKILMLRYS